MPFSVTEQLHLSSSFLLQWSGALVLILKLYDYYLIVESNLGESYYQTTNEIIADKKGKWKVIFHKEYYIYQDPENHIKSQNGDRRTELNEDEKSKKLYKKMFRLIYIINRSIIALTLSFLTYIGLFTVLNNMTSPVQTVTVSSEGPAAVMYPDYMGQYNILRDVYRYDRAVYQHVDREDRFIIYTGRSFWNI